MNKKNSLIIGSGVLGAYMSKELVKRNYNVIVTSRNIKKLKNYDYLNLRKKIKFENLNILDKLKIEKIILKYNPEKIFYFSGQSSITKSLKLKKETFNSHYIGTKNFLDVLNKRSLKTKFFKANSGYIFKSKNGIISLKCKFSKNNNPYIKTQQKVFKLINKYRNKNLNLFNLIFLQIESPLRDKDFLIKKICIHAKNKKKIEVGNIKNIRDYSWIEEICKAVFFTSKLSARDIIISTGAKLSVKKALQTSYKKSGLNYINFFSQNKKFFRKNEEKILIGKKSNHKILTTKFKFKFKFTGEKIVKKMYKLI